MIQTKNPPQARRWETENHQQNISELPVKDYSTKSNSKASSISAPPPPENFPSEADKPNLSNNDDYKSKYQGNGITLDDYASKLQLPRAFLDELGVYERMKDGIPSIHIPFLDENKNEVAVRIRQAWQGSFATTWKSKSKPIPYGIWRGEVLHCCTQNQGEGENIFLVYGEQNAQILWYHKYIALGVPGQALWKIEWNKYLEHFQNIYYWLKPEQNTPETIEQIHKVLPDAKLIFSLEDVDGIQSKNQNLEPQLSQLVSSAKSARQIMAEQKESLAEQARIDAGDLLYENNILDAFYKSCIQQGLVGEERNAKLIYLSLTSRVLIRQVNLVVKGPSSGGKSFTVDSVLPFFPKSAYYVLSAMSDRALIYWDEPMMHRYLILYEAAGINSEILDYMLRSLLSEGRIRYVTVESTNEGLRPREIERLGPTGLILTTTAVSLHPENETRMLSLTVKDDPTQTKLILHALANRANGAEPKRIDLSTWQALQTWLELAGCHEVPIPFANVLAEHSSDSAVRLRRDFGALLILIKTSAILHQMNREKDEAGRIVATSDDYRAVYDLVVDLISEGIDASVKPIVRQTVLAVAQIIQGKSNKVATYDELCEKLGRDDSTISRRVKEAISDGYLRNLEVGDGKLARIILGNPLPKDIMVIPSPDELEKYISCPPLDSDATLQRLFTPSEDWQEIPDDIAVPPGGEYRLELGGKRYGRWPGLKPMENPYNLPSFELVSSNQVPQQLTLNELVRSTPYPDTSRPCFACGETNWILHQDGKSNFCGTCHPTRKEEEK